MKKDKYEYKMISLRPNDHRFSNFEKEIKKHGKNGFRLVTVVKENESPNCMHYFEKIVKE